MNRSSKFKWNIFFDNFIKLFYSNFLHFKFFFSIHISFHFHGICMFLLFFIRVHFQCPKTQTSEGFRKIGLSHSFVSSHFLSINTKHDMELLRCNTGQTNRRIHKYTKGTSVAPASRVLLDIVLYTFLKSYLDLIHIMNLGIFFHPKRYKYFLFLQICIIFNIALCWMLVFSSHQQFYTNF